TLSLPQPQRLTPPSFYSTPHTPKTQKPKNPKTQKPKNPKTQKPKNPKTQKPKNLPAEGRKDLFRLLRFSQPIRSSPKFIKANSIVWMTPNERVGAWMPLGRVCVIGFGKRGSAGTRAREVGKEILLLTLGRRGGAPHQAANGGLSSGRFLLLQNRHFRHPWR